MSSAPKDARQIFLVAIERYAPKQWPGYLDEVCADDPELRQRVEILLEAHVGDESLLDSPAIAPPATIDQSITEKPGDTIGPYKLLQQIGEGGMGVVYMAEQKEPVKRRVALKIIKPGMDTRQVIARFEAERQALAMMDHPNIAKVLDAGATDSGRPYFVMELVNGITVTQFCDEQHLTPKERLELFVPICLAVQHAHQKGIIHRDLKPSNVMVALYDDQPVPKVIDFGVAKATSQALTEKTMFTQLGQIVGTLEYMSPEQAERNQPDIDTRSDIYSLGVVLYELLTGETPFDRERLRSAAFDEMLRIIREEQPIKPSTKVSGSESLPSIAANRKIEPAKLSVLVRGELDWIVMKALEKDRGRRYATATSFAEDIQHYLNDEPVIACPPSIGYRFRKMARKHRWALATSATVLILLLAGVFGTSWQAIRATRAEHRTQRTYENEQIARKNAERAEQRAARETQRANVEAKNAKRQVVQLQVARGNEELRDSDVMGSLVWFAEALRMDEGDADREYVHRLRLANALRACPKICALIGHEERINQAVFSPNGRRFATASSDRTACIWDINGLSDVAPMMHEEPVTDIVFAPDGQVIATAAGSIVQVWDSRTGQPRNAPLQHDDPVSQVRFAANGELLVAVSLANQERTLKVHVWNTETGKPVATELSHPLRKGRLNPGKSCLDVSDEGKRFLTVSPFERDVLVWNVDSLNEPKRIVTHHDKIQHATFSNNGQYILTCGWDRTARIWSTETKQPVTPPLSHEGIAQWGHFSPDDRSVITVSFDQHVRIWSVSSGKLQIPAIPLSSALDRVALSPDGRWFVTAGRDGTAQVRNFATGQLACPPLKHISNPRGISFSPDGRRVLTFDGELTRIWDLAGANVAEQVLVHGTHAVFGPTHWLATYIPYDQRRVNACAVQLWNAETYAPTGPRIHHASYITDVAFSPDESMFASASEDGTARVWNTRTGFPITPWLEHEEKVTSVVWHPDGDRIATTSVDRSAKIWQLPAGIMTATLPHGSAVNCAQFSPNGKWLITGAEMARVWDAADGSAVSKLFHGGNILSVEFAKDGKLLVLSKRKSSGAAIWNVDPLQRVSDMVRHSLPQTGSDFAADGSRFVTTGFDGIARVWDARGKPLGRPVKHENAIYRVVFVNHGRLIATTGDGIARLWDARTGNAVSPSWSMQSRSNLKAGSPNPDSSLLALGGSSTVRVYRITPDPRSVADLSRLAELLSLQRVDSDAGLLRLDTKEVVRLYQQLRGRYRDEFEIAEANLIAWRIEEAKAAERAERWDVAEQLWGQVILQRSERSDYYLARGIAARHWNNTQQAIRDFQRCIELDDRQELAFYHLAWALQEAPPPLQNLEQASLAAEQLAALVLENPSTWNVRGMVALRSKRYEQAIECFSHGLCADEDASFYNNRSLAYSNLGMHDEAIADLRRARDLNIDSYTAHHNLALALHDVGKLEEALRVFERALELARWNVEESPHNLVFLEHSARISRSMANVYREMGRESEARAIAESAYQHASRLAQQFPDRVHFAKLLWEMKFALAVELAASGDRREATTMLEEVLDEYEKWADGNEYLVGLIHLALGSDRKHQAPAQAELHFREAISKLDDDEYRELSLVEQELGNLFLEQGDEQEATRYFRLAIGHAEQDTHASSRAVLANLLASCPIDTLRNPQRAIDISRELLDLSPTNVLARSALGIAHFQLQHWEQAVEYLSGSKTATNHLRLSIAEAQRQDWEKSRQHYQDGLKLESTLSRATPEVNRLQAQAEQLLRDAGQFEPPESENPTPDEDEKNDQ